MLSLNRVARKVGETKLLTENTPRSGWWGSGVKEAPIPLAPGGAVKSKRKGESLKNPAFSRWIVWSEEAALALKNVFSLCSSRAHVNTDS